VIQGWKSWGKACSAGDPPPPANPGPIKPARDAGDSGDIMIPCCQDNPIAKCTVPTPNRTPVGGGEYKGSGALGTETGTIHRNFGRRYGPHRVMHLVLSAQGSQRQGKATVYLKTQEGCEA